MNCKPSFPRNLRYWPILSPALLAFYLCFSPASFAENAAGDKHYLQELINAAHTQQLAQTPQWQYLLHYKENLLGSLESEADDPAFFAAAQGKTDPQAELDATLAAFFSPRPWGKKDEPAQCAFVARYQWLKARLHFDPQRLPPLPCPDFEKWYAGINPGSLTLVFPSAYINNPSSMFGHTLLRVDPPGQDENTRLLSYAINYGAETGNDNGVAFAIKGIFGGYYGGMGIGPYYKKVKEYSDFESRDIWEYQLAFSAEEIQRLLAHVWELRGIHFEYYFFDENCSYLILTLLDVARPSLALSEQLHGWVIPSDTLRLVTNRPRLVTKTVYRPAAGTRLAHLAASLSDEAQDTALALADEKLSLKDFLRQERPPQQRADILLLAHDYLRYEFLAQRREKTASARLSRQLLRARSRIAEARPPAPAPRPAVSPEQGHATGMLQAGLSRENKDNYLQLRLRPAYHDLLDSDAGYVPGAQIDFLNIAARYDTRREKLSLDAFTLVDIVSLTPRSRFFHPTSWRIRASWQRRLLPGSRSPSNLAFAVDGGGGLALRPTDGLLLFALLDGALLVNSHYQDDYSAGLGAETGALLQLGSRWKLQLRAQVMSFRSGNPHRYEQYSVDQRLVINPQQALNLSWSQQRAFGRRLENWMLSWRWYL